MQIIFKCWFNYSILYGFMNRTVMLIKKYIHVWWNVNIFNVIIFPFNEKEILVSFGKGIIC